MEPLSKYCLACCVFVLTGGANGSGNEEGARLPRMPMPVPFENTTTCRWLNKPVQESRLLDGMENGDKWSHHGFGTMTFTQERARDGKQSLRLVSPTLSGKPSPNGRPFGAAVALRQFAGEDWREHNRLSFWVYPTLPGFRVISMSVALHNEGEERVPGPYDRNGRNFFLLNPDEWNHIVWEIAHLGRDKVTGLEFSYRLQGHEPEAAETVCYDLDHLELQKVDADHYEGWDVSPGRIAFSHTGYAVGGSNSAIGSDISSSTFRLVNAETGKVALSKLTKTVTSHIGRFQFLDFSEVRQPGTYFIEAGNTKTPPFRIVPNVWRDTIVKTINLFYCERCGADIPGVHGVCHRDWQCAHGDRRLVINGGWHDAGDLSQGVINTGEAAYAMFALAERLGDDDPALAKRLIEEGRWGLDWMLRTRFGDGYRTTWATMDFWTDGTIGTVDDMVVRARNSSFDNFIAASTEAFASRVLNATDPVLASSCLKAARDDWQFALDRARSSNLQLAAAGAQASLELFRATRESQYAEKAFELASVIVDSQQRSFTDWRVPLCGFFYTSPRKNRILHYSHRSHEQAPVVALTQLCESFPDHPDWMKWYSAVVLYSEYLKTVSKFTEPYDMVPGSVYRAGESNRAEFRKQILNGIPIGDEHYLRLFPVWNNGYRGNNGTLLSQAKALSTAAHLRRDPELADLSQKQLQWVVGRNPFSQSTMYGEGCDYAPQYTAMSGDMVGSLAVGIQTRFENDVPYWPADNCYNFKEVWVHPSARWLWIMCDLAGPARVRGQTEAGRDGGIEFRDVVTGHSTAVKPDVQTGRFEVRLAEGTYRVRCGGRERTITLLPRQTYELDLRRHLDFELSQETRENGEVTIELNANGEGPVRFAIRAYNLKVNPPEVEADLETGKEQTIGWRGKVVSAREPWVAVIFPEGHLAERQEITGSVQGGGEK